jgi:hypothetical protein
MKIKKIYHRRKVMIYFKNIIFPFFVIPIRDDKFINIIDSRAIFHHILPLMGEFTKLKIVI